MFRCPTCAKTFTGRVCYDQHLASDKHKRKVLTATLFSNQNGLSNNAADGVVPIASGHDSVTECQVCNIAFNSFENFQRHSQSREHALKVIQEKTDSNEICSVTSTNQSSDNQEGGVDKYATKSINENDMLLPDLDKESFGTKSLTNRNCDACHKLFSSSENYKQHLESETHQMKVKAQKNISAGINLRCETCKKTFSGQAPYIEHMDSQIHKKKVQQLLLSNGHSSDTEVNNAADIANNFANPWFCNICKVQCSGIAPYNEHIAGGPHLKNVKRNELFRSALISQNNVKPGMLENESNANKSLEEFNNISQSANDSNQEDDKMDTEVNNTADRANNFANPWFCNICKVQCSGIAPYKAHIAGGPHLKNAKRSELFRSALTSQNNVKPTVLENESNANRSLEEINNISQPANASNLKYNKMDTEVNYTADKANDFVNPWFCNICKVQCSGIEPYNEHIVGGPHLKNVKRNELFHSALISQNNVKPVLANGSNANRSLEEFNNISQLANGSKQKDDKMDTDYLLPELQDNFKVMCTDELKKSITFFLPDEKINFGKSDEDKHADVENENANQDGVKQNQKDLKSEVSEESQTLNDGPGEMYQVCSVCDVKLFNSDDIAQHYESKEHIRKKFGAEI